MAEYFNPGESRSLFNFTTSLQNLLEKKNYHSRDIVLVCIGSDRATGDCLGPIVGHKVATFFAVHIKAAPPSFSARWNSLSMPKI
ncbi:MAG: DUF1256 domain-containing protein [Clostridium sp.]